MSEQISVGPSVGVMYHITMQLRWVEQVNTVADILGSTRELQQAWRGDDGSVRWLLVPTIKEAAETSAA